ncbi:SDR family oxidoreductase [Microbispora sp. NPDC088329]|uniref:SDR family oxidoreductase n=1 Tax=Microbispora sp. NPDC088329 TaxID=3154869 RepID=UPI003426B46D
MTSIGGRVEVVALARQPAFIDAWNPGGEPMPAVGAGADRLLTVAGDTADAGHVRQAVDLTMETFGRLDNVVVNAGFSLPGTLADHSPEYMRSMVLTNVLGPALVVQAVLPHLRRTGGRLVLVGSVAGVKNTPGNLYSVTKWALHALAENTRLMVTGDGVGVTLVAPGMVDTPSGTTAAAAPAPRS